MSSNLPFVFKQFKIHHDICGMKIGVDGVLLGAWTKAENPLRILDVGTGSGLIALMMAQKFPSAEIFAIDINADAILQTQQNISECAFTNVFHVIQQDFLHYSPNCKFDIIVANLPYHPKSVEILEINRAQARLAEFLPLVHFLNHANVLLSEKGIISLVYPVDYLNDIKQHAEKLNLHVKELCYIKGNSNAACKRILLSLSKQNISCSESSLILESSRNQKTHEYDALTRAFYLEK